MKTKLINQTRIKIDTLIDLTRKHYSRIRTARLATVHVLVATTRCQWQGVQCPPLGYPPSDHLSCLSAHPSYSPLGTHPLDIPASTHPGLGLTPSTVSTHP